MGVVVSPLFSYYGYSSTIIAIGAILCLGVGLVASVFAGMFLDKTKAYLCTLRIFCLIATFIFLSALWVAPIGNSFLAVSLLTIAGIAMVPVTPLGFAFAVELTHPI